jgi:PAS domain S-box-containing protein
VLSFRFKTIIGIAIIETVLLIILIISVLGFLNTSHEKEINERAYSTAKLFASMTKDAILAYDLASLKSFVDEILTNEDILYARVISDNITLAEGGEKSLLNRAFKSDMQLVTIDDNVFDVSANVTESEQVFGRVELGLSISRITSVLEQSKKWAIVIAAVEVILVAVFSFILGTWLTRQLSQLKHASNIIAEKGPGNKVEVKGNDEIAQVADAFNFMSDKLQKSYQDLKNQTMAYKKIAELANADEAFKSAVLSSSLDAIISIDLQGNIVEYNQAAEMIFGYKRKEVMGQSMSELIIPETYRKQHLMGMQRFLDSGEATIINQRLELEALHKSGRVFPVEFTVSLIENNDKIFFTSFIRDITEQANDKKELLLANAAFESHEAIFVCDKNNKILRVNKAFTEITGYSSEEILGKNPNLLSSGFHDSQFYSKFYQSIKDNGRWEGEIYNKRKNGDIFPEWLAITVVKNKKGDTINYVAHFVDITKRKSAEQELKRAIKAAEQANEAKSHFLATMSHEIRTPMNAVLGTINLLKDTPINNEQRIYIDTAHQSAEALLHIINDILDFSKIDADKLIIESSSFSIKDLINLCAQMLNVNAKNRDNTIQTYIDPKIPDRLISDSKRIKQILLNLISNAIKFTENGDITISVTPVNISKENVTLDFSVSDTGIGMKKSSLANLFNPFYQVEQNKNRSYEGTGLGLAISKKLIDLLGGDIGVESEENKGSHFWFTLTLDIDKSSENLSEMTKANKDIEASINNNILLVEDSFANVVVARAILEKSGYQVDIAENGFQAIEKLELNSPEQHYYDLILMDMMMPKMDGIEATKHIRQMPEPISQTPIIAMTANAIKGDKEKCLEAGMNDYIAKPYDAKDFLNKVSMYCSSNHDKTDNNSLKPDEIHNSLVSHKALQQLANDTSEELLPEMIAIFIKELQKRLNNIKTALEENDINKIAIEVHTLKSSSGTYGALKLHAFAVEIDSLYKAEKHDQALQISKGILDLIEKTINAYEKYEFS